MQAKKNMKLSSSKPVRKKSAVERFKERCETDRSTKVTVIVCIIISLTAIIGCLVYFLAINENTKLDVFNRIETVTDKDNPDLATEYVNETKYIGGIGYPEVYKIPFKKTDNYIKNKEYVEKFPTQAAGAVANSKAYMAAVFSMDYREIQQDTQSYIDGLKKYLHDNLYYEDYADNGVFVSEEYANATAEYLSEHEIACDVKFLTDESLVYEDGYVYVRGVLELTVYNNKDESKYFGYEKGVMTPVIIEVRLVRADENPEDMRVFDVKVVQKIEKQ